MPEKILDVPVRDFFTPARATAQANDANGLTSGRRGLPVAEGATEVVIYASAVARVAFTPRVQHFYWHDVSADLWVDLLANSRRMVDIAGTANDISFTLAAADALYIATNDRVGGWRFDLDASVNNDNNDSNVSFAYSSGSQFVSSDITDGTINASNRSFEQDGNITIDSVPAKEVWTPQRLDRLVSSAKMPQDLKLRELHWSRLTPAADQDAVEIERLTPLHVDPWEANTSNSRGSSLLVQATTVTTVDVHPEVGGVEFISALTTGTPTIDLSWVYTRL